MVKGERGRGYSQIGRAAYAAPLYMVLAGRFMSLRYIWCWPGGLHRAAIYGAGRAAYAAPLNTMLAGRFAPRRYIWCWSGGLHRSAMDRGGASTWLLRCVGEDEPHERDPRQQARCPGDANDQPRRRCPPDSAGDHREHQTTGASHERNER